MAWLDWGYVAGFFDGEGCVDCREGRQVTGTIRRQFRLKIYQNQREVLDTIRDFLSENGIVSRVEVHLRPDRLKKGHQGLFALVVNGASDVYRMLLRMEKYLIVKREEADYVIEWLEELRDEALAGRLDGRGGARHVYAALEGVS